MYQAILIFIFVFIYGICNLIAVKRHHVKNQPHLWGWLGEGGLEWIVIIVIRGFTWWVANLMFATWQTFLIPSPILSFCYGDCMFIFTIWCDKPCHRLTFIAKLRASILALFWHIVTRHSFGFHSFNNRLFFIHRYNFIGVHIRIQNLVEKHINLA